MNCNCKSPCNPCRCGMAEGERRKAAAIGLLSIHRVSQIRRIQRLFLTELLCKIESTTDNVTDETPLVYRRSCLGAATNHLARAGLIDFVRFAVSTRPDRHACPVRVWRLADRNKAICWLATHPELPDAETSEAVAVSQRVLFPTITTNEPTPTVAAAGAGMEQ